MAFAKQEDRFLLVAILSFFPDTNLFVAPNGRWLGGYVPSVFRGFPFQLAKAEGHDNPILCVDEDSGLVNDDKTAGEPFFDETGEVSQPVKDILHFLIQVEQNRTATNLAVASLAEAGVITEWPLKEKQITFAQIMQAMMVLTGGGHVCPVQEDAVISKVKKNQPELTEKAEGFAEKQVPVLRALDEDELSVKQMRKIAEKAISEEAGPYRCASFQRQGGGFPLYLYTCP